LCSCSRSLEFLNIFTDDGKINANGGQFANMMRFDARIAVEEELTKLVRASLRGCCV
jgi:valyl-tRNA synthetase